MRSSLFALAAVAARALAANPAPITNDNPVGTVYKAEMPQLNSSSITGYASATGNTNGTGVVWSINFQNLPKTGGPFAYHVHEQPVPADGNCTGAGPHLDPENRTEEPPCDLGAGQKSCQVGDLAGKHGKMTNSTWAVFYLDLYTSTTPGSPAFVGNRSIVIHDAATNRIACTNVTMLAFASEPDASGSSSSAGSSSGSGSSSSASASSATATSSTSATAKQEAAATSSSPAVAQGAASGLKSNGAATAAVGLAAFIALAL